MGQVSPALESRALPAGPEAFPRLRTPCLRSTLPGQGGLTLIEILILLGVIATLSTISLLVYQDVTERARVTRAVADIATLQSEISTFEATNLRLPNDLSEIGRATFLDPWGSPYQYLNFSLGVGQPRKDHSLHPLNSDYDLYSKGEDGATATPLTAQVSRDDVIRANDGQFIGLASQY